MAAAKYTVLHEFHTRVSNDTGEEKLFTPGMDYDGPPERVATLLAGIDHHGPLIAEKASSASEGK